MLKDAHGAGRLAGDERDLTGVEAPEYAQKHDLGLIGRELAEARERCAGPLLRCTPARAGARP